MKVLVLEERVDQLNNAVKNITLLLNQMHQTLQDEIERHSNNTNKHPQTSQLIKQVQPGQPVQTNQHGTIMAIKKEKISGKLIINEYDSSNLKKSEYNTETNELVIEFKKGG